MVLLVINWLTEIMVMKDLIIMCPQQIVDMARFVLMEKIKSLLNCASAHKQEEYWESLIRFWTMNYVQQ